MFRQRCASWPDVQVRRRAHAGGDVGLHGQADRQDQVRWGGGSKRRQDDHFQTTRQRIRSCQIRGTCVRQTGRRKQRNVLFNDALNTFYLWLYGVGHRIKDHSDSERRNPLPPHTLLFPIRDLLSSLSHRQDSTYHNLCYTNHRALAGTRNSSMDPPRRINLMIPFTKKCMY